MVVVASKVILEAAKVITRDAILEAKGFEELPFNSSPLLPPPAPHLVQFLFGFSLADDLLELDLLVGGQEIRVVLIGSRHRCPRGGWARRSRLALHILWVHGHVGVLKLHILGLWSFVGGLDQVVHHLVGIHFLQGCMAQLGRRQSTLHSIVHFLEHAHHHRRVLGLGMTSWRTDPWRVGHPHVAHRAVDPLTEVVALRLQRSVLVEAWPLSLVGSWIPAVDLHSATRIQLCSFRGLAVFGLFQ